MSEGALRDPAAPAAVPLLAPGAEFEGLLVLHGAARIDGRLRGEVVGATLLEIGKTGSVEASIEADEVIVAGRLQGDIRAQRRVELTETARVSGRIETPRLVVAEGALVDGPCRVGGAAPVAPGGREDGAGSP